MSPADIHTRLSSALSRIASRTNILRVRTDDSIRTINSVGATPEKDDRLLAVVTRLERVANELEAL